MTPRWPTRSAGLIALLLALPCAARAGEPAAPTPGVEVLTRGPVHEAYALPAGQQAPPGELSPRRPPEPIEELPPEQKPAGDDVRWISGYWSYDLERKDFVWVSGFWRVPPPGRVWVPGSWREDARGWLWVGGFWGPAAEPAEPAQPGAVAQAQLEYLPPPPASVESGPPTPAPAAESLYLPGNWVHRGRYLWQPGCWVEPRPGWVWTPACYRWTPAGYLFVDGYWDHPLEERGVLFPPVAIAPEVYAAPNFAYTPAYAVQEQAIFGSLFVGGGNGSYYFGDYFEERYANAGYTPWCAGAGYGGGFGGPRGFGFSFNFQRGFRDPLFDYYQSSRRGDPFWSGGGIGQLYAGRYRGDIGRPPRTLVQQNGLVNNSTVNNTTVFNNTTINNATVVSPLRAGQRAGGRDFTTIGGEARSQFAGDARPSRDVARQRTLVETQFAARPPRPTAAPPEPRRAALNLPPQTPARAQAPGTTVGNSATRAAPPRPQAARPAAQAGVASAPRPSPTANNPVPPRLNAAAPTAKPQVTAAPQLVNPVTRPEAKPSASPTPRVESRPSAPPQPATVPPQAPPAVTRPSQAPAPARPAAPQAPAALPQPARVAPQPMPPRPAPQPPAPQAAPRPAPAPSRQPAPAPARPAAPQPPAPVRVMSAPPQPAPQAAAAPRPTPAPSQPPSPAPAPARPTAPRAPAALPPPARVAPQPMPPRPAPQPPAPPRAMSAPPQPAPQAAPRPAPAPSRPPAPAPPRPPAPPQPTGKP